MYPYFIMIAVPSVLALFSRRSEQAGMALAAVFLMFVGLIGLRYDIGPDWFAYSTHFDRFRDLNLTELIAEGEFGWSLLVRLVDGLGLGMVGLTLFAALVFCIGVFAVARSCQEPMVAIVAAVPYLSIAVAMSGMRQAVAIGIVFFLISRWYRWPIGWKIGVILLAATFHFSALAMLAIVALEARLTIVQRVLVAIVIAVILAYMISASAARIDEYTENYGAGGGAADAPGAVYHVLLTAGPALVYFFVRKRWLKEYGRIIIIDMFAAIGVFALAMVFFFPTVTDRMTLYFSAVALIIQANLPHLWDSRSERFLVRSAIIILNIVAMTTFLVAGNKAKSFVPYESQFSENAQFGLPRR